MAIETHYPWLLEEELRLARLADAHGPTQYERDCEAAKAAIQRSRNGGIVHLPYSAGAADTLLSWCESNTDHDYYGDDWRVILDV